LKPKYINTLDWFKYNGLFLAEHFLGKSLYSKLLGVTEKHLIGRIDSKLSKLVLKDNTHQFLKELLQLEPGLL